LAYLYPLIPILINDRLKAHIFCRKIDYMQTYRLGV
jgi:hypothetical protein